MGSHPAVHRLLERLSVAAGADLMFGIRTGIVNHGGTFADMPLEGQNLHGFCTRVAMESFGAVLRRAGYQTCMISPFPNRHTAYQVGFGFSETYVTAKAASKMPMRCIHPPARRSFWGVIAEGGPLHAKVGSRDWNAYLERLQASGRGHHADALANYAGRPIART